jgi:Flp pilus assembly protein TadD
MWKSLVSLVVLASALVAPMVSAQVAPPPSPSTATQQRTKLLELIDLYRKDKLTEALAGLEELAKSAPDNADVQAWLGFLYLRADRPSDAIAPLRRASELRPKDVETLVNLATRCSRATRRRTPRRSIAKRPN